MGRTLADITDYQYSLFSNNQHPLQLFAYESYNKYLRLCHDPTQKEQNEEIIKRIMDVTFEREDMLETEEGERLSVDDVSDIYKQVMGEFRNKNNFSLTTRDRQGNINDYLEVRRPFGAAAQ